MKPHHVTVRVSVEYKEKLQKLAEDHKMTQNDIIEALLDGSDAMQEQNREQVKKIWLNLRLSSEHQDRFRTLAEDCNMTQEEVVKTLLDMPETKIVSCCETKRQQNAEEKATGKKTRKKVSKGLRRAAPPLRVEEDTDGNLMNWLETACCEANLPAGS
jgi:predicted transcriptional regulator